MRFSRSCAVSKAGLARPPASVRQCQRTLHIRRSAAATEKDDGSSLKDTLLSVLLDFQQQEIKAVDQREPEAIMELSRMLSLLPGTASGDGNDRSTFIRRHGFCTNCCAPSRMLEPCGFCGHHPANDMQLLGRPDVWHGLHGTENPAPSKHQMQVGADPVETAAAASTSDGSSSNSSSSDSSNGNNNSGVATMADASRAAQRKASTTVAIGYDERLLLHRGALWPHPERPERLQAIMTRLTEANLIGRCDRLPSREATNEELEAVHSPEYVAAIAATGQQLDRSPSAASAQDNGASTATSGADSLAQVLPFIAPDTQFNQHSNAAARLSAGIAVEAAQAVASGRCDAALALIRPPGHQAGRDRASGGCFFNSAAVAARAAQAAGASRVLILDWGVHHGGGTQSIFQDDGSVLFVSLHRYGNDFFPATGKVTDIGGRPPTPGDEAAAAVGGGNGTSNVGRGLSVNIPWTHHEVGDADFMSAMMHVVLPVVYDFGPDMIIVSAGFDAAAGDFVGSCLVTPEGFAGMTHLLRGVAPVVMLLEGGYNLEATARSVESCLRVLLGERPPRLQLREAQATDWGWAGIMNAMQVQCHFWDSVMPLSLTGWMRVVDQQREAEARRRLQFAQQGGQQGGNEEGEDEEGEEEEEEEEGPRVEPNRDARV